MKRRKPRQLRYVWAVNYATPDDWECVRDNGHHDGTEDLAEVTCLPDLYTTKKRALDGGQAQWENDRYPDDDTSFVTKDNEAGQRVVSNKAGLLVLICARRLKLPVTR